MVEAHAKRLTERYLLREPIGSGGMGTVWRAYDEMLRRDVAIKELRIPDGVPEDERAALRKRAMREAQAAAGLDHPGIIAVHDVLLLDDRPWIVMPLVDGRSLDQEVSTNGPLHPDRVADLGRQLVEALMVAHGREILHRDIKPQNIMLTRNGRAILTDFGIASIAGATRLTQTDAVVGTFGYVAPERLLGRRAGKPSDLWSLGATLFYAVEGGPAYVLEDPHDPYGMIGAVLADRRAPMRRAGALRPVLDGLLHPDPDQRLDGRASRHLLSSLPTGPTSAAPPRAPTTSAAPPPSAPTRVGSPDLPSGPEATRIGPADDGRSARAGGGPARVVTVLVVLVLLVAAGIWFVEDRKFLEPERFRATPHLCARMLDSKAELATLVPRPSITKPGTGTAEYISCSWESEGADTPRGELTIKVRRFDRDLLVTGAERAQEWLVSAAKDWSEDATRVSGFGADEAFMAGADHGDYAGSGRHIFRVDNVVVDIHYEFSNDEHVFALPQNRANTLARYLASVLRAW